MNESLKQLLTDYRRLLAYVGVVVLVLLAFFLLAKTIDAFERMGKSPYAGPNVITVTGTGKAETPPTIARIVFTVQETADTVAAAQDAATARTRDALDAIRALGVEDQDIQASSYQVNPQYARPQPCVPGAPCPEGGPRITGYQVSQTITVKLRNTDMAGEVLQALGTAGVQNINGPNFEVDDDSDVMQRARGAAIEEARREAKVLARQLGVDLGEVVSFSESGGPFPPVPYGTGAGPMMDMERSTAQPPLPQGQNESTVTVTITYEIE